MRLVIELIALHLCFLIIKFHMSVSLENLLVCLVSESLGAYVMLLI